MKKVWMFILKIAIAVLIIAYLIHAHYHSFADGIKNFKTVWLIPALLILYAEMALCALRWFYLLKIIKINITKREALSLTMRGYFCSLILPGGAVGGDVAKIGMIAHAKSKGERFEPGLSILIDRIIGMIALFAIAIILIIADFTTLQKINLSALGIPAAYNNYVIIAFVLVCLLGIIAAGVLFCYRIFEKIPFCKFILEKADIFSKGLVSRMKSAIDLYINQWRSLLFLVIGSIFLVHLIQMPILYSVCCGLDVKVPSLLTLTTAIIIGNIAGLIPLTPSGIGLRDLAIFTILQAGAFNEVAPIVLLMSMVLIIGNVSGGLFFFDNGLRKNEKKNDILEDTCNI